MLRIEIRRRLERLCSDFGSYRFLTNEFGLYAKFNLNEEQVKKLELAGIRVRKDGTINISALNLYNIDAVAMALHQVL